LSSKIGLTGANAVAATPRTTLLHSRKTQFAAEGGVAVDGGVAAEGGVAVAVAVMYSTAWTIRSRISSQTKSSGSSVGASA
jgi:hypothetical protein